MGTDAYAEIRATQAALAAAEQHNHDLRAALAQVTAERDAALAALTTRGTDLRAAHAAVTTAHTALRWYAGADTAALVADAGGLARRVLAAAERGVG